MTTRRVWKHFLAGLGSGLLLLGAMGCGGRELEQANRLYDLGRYTDAAIAYAPLAADERADFEVRRKYALAVALSGDAERALPLLEALIKVKPDPELAAAHIDAVTLLKGNDEGSVLAASYETLYKDDPNVLRAAGTLASQRGDRATARLKLEKALSLQPGLASALANLGDLRLRDGDVTGAMDYYQRAVDAQPNSPMSVRVRVRMAQMLAESRPPEAIRILEAAAAVEPGAPDVLAEMGKMLAALGLYDDAIDKLKDAWDLKMERPEVMSTLGYCYLQRGSGNPDPAASRQDLLAARMWLGRLLQKEPTWRGGYNNLGRVLLRLGENEEAEAAFRQELGLYPDSLEALTNLGRYLVDQGQLPQAKELFEKAFQVDRSQVALAAELGRLALLENDWTAGQRWYETASALCEQVGVGHPCQADVPFHLARVAGHRRDTEASVQFLIKAMSNGYRDVGRMKAEGDLRAALADQRVAMLIQRLEGAVQ